MRPAWFDLNEPDQHHLVFLQGDRRSAGAPEDGVIARRQIAQVLIGALVREPASYKTFELVAEKGSGADRSGPAVCRVGTGPARLTQRCPGHAPARLEPAAVTSYIPGGSPEPPAVLNPSRP
ncbi:Rossmann-fold NAD(P)-binding domain-containing protein [Sinorhizobium medicae]|uniref:hypothetical protein n=1 Tax=Sinorhizobium medicae TaxID=110321 RepID=UPI002278BA9E|nr:hypothetical protein [Sinorhizobium medicae]